MLDRHWNWTASPKDFHMLQAGLTFIRHLRDSKTNLWPYIDVLTFHSQSASYFMTKLCYFLSVLGWAFPINIPSQKHGWARAPPGLQHSPLGCVAYCVYYFSGWSDPPLCLNSVTKWQEAHIRAGFRQVTSIELFHYPFTCFATRIKDLCFMFSTQPGSHPEQSFTGKWEIHPETSKPLLSFVFWLRPHRSTETEMLFLAKIVFLDEKILLQ